MYYTANAVFHGLGPGICGRVRLVLGTSPLLGAGCSTVGYGDLQPVQQLVHCGMGLAVGGCIKQRWRRCGQSAAVADSRQAVHIHGRCAQQVAISIDSLHCIDSESRQ